LLNDCNAAENERHISEPDIQVKLANFWHKMLCRVQYCYTNSFVHDIRVDRGHVGWNPSKIISRLISVDFILSVDANITDPLQKEHPQIVVA